MKCRSLLSIVVLFLATAAFAKPMRHLAEPMNAFQGPPAPYTVTLTWVDSTTSGATGQNVYRAAYTTACGAYTVLSAGANIAPSLTSFVDSTVIAGASYCYGLTDIGGNGKESSMDVNSNNPVLIPPAPPTGLGAAVQ
jgi:hypothetical protein